MKKILSLAFCALVAFGVSVAVVGCSTTSKPEEKKKEATTADTPKVVEGKFVSLKDDKLTIHVGEKDQEFDVKGVKDVPKADDMKDAKIAVTSDKDAKVTKVEVKK